MCKFDSTKVNSHKIKSVNVYGMITDKRRILKSGITRNRRYECTTKKNSSTYGEEVMTIYVKR